MEGSVHMGEPVECESALIRLSGTNLDTVWESLCAETILSVDARRASTDASCPARA